MSNRRAVPLSSRRSRTLRRQLERPLVAVPHRRRPRPLGWRLGPCRAPRLGPDRRSPRDRMRRRPCTSLSPTLEPSEAAASSLLPPPPPKLHRQRRAILTMAKSPTMRTTTTLMAMIARSTMTGARTRAGAGSFAMPPLRLRPRRKGEERPLLSLRRPFLRCLGLRRPFTPMEVPMATARESYPPPRLRPPLRGRVPPWRATRTRSRFGRSPSWRLALHPRTVSMFPSCAFLSGPIPRPCTSSPPPLLAKTTAREAAAALRSPCALPGRGPRTTWAPSTAPPRCSWAAGGRPSSRRAATT